MKWIDNICDPEDPCAPYMHTNYLPGQTMAQAWAQHIQYLSDKIIGRPRATEKHTVEELESFGMVGVYIKEEE